MAVPAVQPVPVGEDAPLAEVMATMRAMRRLAPDPVPDELLRRLVEAATWAPTGGNGQGYRFVVVTDREQIARTAALWRVTVDWYLDTVGSVTPAAMSDEAYARMVAAIRYQRDNFAVAPALIVPCYDMRVAWDPARRAGLGRILRGTLALGPRRVLWMAGNRRIFGDGVAASVYPAVQNLLLAARSLGLAATLTIWHLGLEHEYKAILGIPRHVRTYGIVPVGWPLGRMGPVRRPPAEAVMHRDHWAAGWESHDVAGGVAGPAAVAGGVAR
jgi:nitroreductase